MPKPPGKLVFNHELCTGCRACELACSFRKEGVFAPARAWIKIVRVDEEGVDIPIGCEHCDQAPCITACPTRALSRDSNINAVVLNSDFCIGCKQCMVICPFGAIRYDTARRVFYKCDLCGGEPECVKWCVTGGVQYLENLETIVKHKHERSVERTLSALSELKGSSSFSQSTHSLGHEEKERGGGGGEC